MFKNLWNFLSWFSQLEEVDAILEEDVVIGDILNALIVKERVTFKRDASLCMTFLTRQPVSLS